MWQNSKNKWEKKIVIVLFVWYVWVFFFVLVGSWCSNSSISNFLNIFILMCMWLFQSSVVTIRTFKIYLFWWFWRMFEPYVDRSFIVFTDKAYIWYSVMIRQANVLIIYIFLCISRKCHKTSFYSKKNWISTKTRIVGFNFIKFMKGRLFLDIHH